MDSYRQMILFLFLTPLHVGQALRCACTENLGRCASLHKMPANFQTAQSECRAIGGKLIQAGSSLSNDTIATLLISTTGHFWTGLEPRKTCSSNQNDSVECPQRCLSVSNGKKWTESACEGILDGFLCDRVPWDTTCSMDKTENVILLNKDGCISGPCEHKCEIMHNGYTCQCMENFKPSKKDPTRCERFCLSPTCKVLCSGKDCYCPPGFIRDEGNCVDVDECGSNHNCEHLCMNTIGSYVCSCKEDFGLVNGYACVPNLSLTTTLQGLFITPSLNYTSGRAALASPGEYVGIVVFIMAALFGLIMLARYLTKQKSDVGLKDCDVLDEIQQGL